ncbi:zinc ribbon domain-containing protein [Guptibacillus algicola]|uniref:zinc ribbon domain-containing protein n=1 Tax=Guptibacillus algicola TaxID=225844 RepID=UPI001CD778EC|nr:zinc ribbon domain-containing protein [Alkalihalobacillus algicola]MCA0987025.1 zinc ribbon domain-containing protein [Alkalihalobacillus algicola]
MNCSNCGAVYEENAKFCGGCGGQLNTNNANEAAQLNQQQVTQQMTAATVSTTGTANNEYLEKGKQISKNFFSFALEAFKGPMVASHKVTDSDKLNGIISLLLYAFLLPFFSYLTTKNLTNQVNNEFFPAASIPVPFGATVIQPFFYILIFLAVFTAVNFGVAKLMRVDLSFTNVMTRFGVFVVIPATLLFLAVLFAFISANFLSALFFFIGLGLFTVSSTSLLFSLKEKSSGGLDVYYGLIITNVVMFIFFVIVVMTVLDRIINEMGSMLPFGF